MRITLRFLLTLLLILPLISCDKEQEEAIKELKITPTPTAAPEPTIFGLWREGPMEMEDNLDSTISFERIENETSIKLLNECDLGALELEYDFADLAKSYLFHFFQNGELNIHITIHTPDKVECMADTMDDIPYILSEHNSLSIDGRYVGYILLRSYEKIDLMIGPI